VSDVIDADAGDAAVAKFNPDLATIRTMSTLLPGPLPVAVNGTRVAASIRPRKFVIQGGDDTPVTMPRTAFVPITIARVVRRSTDGRARTDSFVMLSLLARDLPFAAAFLFAFLAMRPPSCVVHSVSPRRGPATIRAPLSSGATHGEGAPGWATAKLKGVR